MRTFFIFKKKNYPTKVVDNGFSIISFFFGFFWGIYKQLWLPVTINLSLILIISFYSTGFTTGFVLISNIFWGFFGKDLLIQKYLKIDYSPENVVNATSKEKALLIYQAKN
tara:strand:+ start:628 stop:960 length:333 start_codon:yes stop_codon:yes gene_type:complete